MNAEALGKAISEATRFLQGIHHDVRSQIGSLDRLMAARDWVPADPNRMSGQLGNSLNDGRIWVPDYVHRCYARAEEAYVTRHVVVVLWYFAAEPGEAYQVATCAAVAARLAAPTAPNSLLPHGKWSPDGLYEEAERSAIPVVLTASAIKMLLPNAVIAKGFVLPLCELTSDAILEGRLVSPILAAEAALGAQS